MGFDSHYARRAYQRLQRLGGVHILFDNLVVLGQENLQGGQALELANHVSHADYMARWWASYERGLPIPAIPAGVNLNSPVLQSIGLDFSKLCGFWVDRSLLKSNGRSAFSHARELQRMISNVAESGESILIFGDGGRYDGPPMNRFEPAGVRAFIRHNPDLLLRPIAFGYDSRVEEWVMDRVAAHREKKDFWYRFYDFSSFMLRPVIKQFRDVGNAYMNVGRPVRISDITTSKGVEARVEEIRKYSAEEIQRLYDEIQKAKN